MAAMVCLLLFVNDRSDLWLIYVVAALYGLGGDLFAAARSAMLKAMLPDELLAEANGMLQSLREGLRLVAPLAGAGIFAAFGGAAVALVDAGELRALRRRRSSLLRFVEPAVRRARAVPARGLRRGRAHRAHARAARADDRRCAVMLVAGFSETIIFALTADGLHRPPSFIGVIATFQGIGAIVGGLTAPMLMRRLGDLRLAGLGVVLFGVGDVLWLVPRLAVVLPATASQASEIAWAVVALATSYQRRSPTEVQGRVNAAANMLFSVPQTISIAVGAALITVIDYRLLIVAMAAVFALASALPVHAPRGGIARALRLQLLPKQPVDDLRVGLALRLLHHLADEEAEHALLAAAVGLDLLRVRGDDGVDRRAELGLVADRGLREVVVGVDRAVAAPP